MIYQIQVGQGLVSGAPGGVYEIPFYGRYRVKLIKIDWIFNAGAVIIQNLIRLESQTLLLNTPLTNGFMFVNNTNSLYNIILNEDLEINGQIDLRLARVTGQAGAYPGIGVAGGYIDCMITLDFEKVVVDQSMVGFSGNKPLLNF